MDLILAKLGIVFDKNLLFLEAGQFCFHKRAFEPSIEILCEIYKTKTKIKIIITARVYGKVIFSYCVCLFVCVCLSVCQAVSLSFCVFLYLYRP